MPRTPSALKALRVSQRRYVRNRSVRSALRTYVKKARTTLERGALEEAPELVKLAASQLDKAASKGIIHPNQAARRKSRLMKLVAVAGAAAAEEAATEAPAAPGRARTTTARAPRAPASGARATATRARTTGPTRSRTAGAAAEEKPAPRTRRAAAASSEEKPAPAPRARRTTSE